LSQEQRGGGDCTAGHNYCLCPNTKLPTAVAGHGNADCTATFQQNPFGTARREHNGTPLERARQK
jgi:hypothetical protein